MKIFSYLFIFIFFYSCKNEITKTLSYKGCEIKYSYYKNGEIELYKGHSISNKWLLESANRELALCLCEEYIKNPDIEVKMKILKIFKSKEEYFSKEYSKNLLFDSIIKNRKKIFDPIILID